jgi:hypothetical protein
VQPGNSYPDVTPDKRALSGLPDVVGGFLDDFPL